MESFCPTCHNNGKAFILSAILIGSRTFVLSAKTIIPQNDRRVPPPSVIIMKVVVLPAINDGRTFVCIAVFGWEGFPVGFQNLIIVGIKEKCIKYISVNAEVDNIILY